MPVLQRLMLVRLPVVVSHILVDSPQVRLTQQPAEVAWHPFSLCAGAATDSPGVIAQQETHGLTGAAYCALLTGAELRLRIDYAGAEAASGSPAKARSPVKGGTIETVFSDIMAKAEAERALSRVRPKL